MGDRTGASVWPRSCADFTQPLFAPLFYTLHMFLIQAFQVECSIIPLTTVELHLCWPLRLQRSAPLRSRSFALFSTNLLSFYQHIVGFTLVPSGVTWASYGKYYCSHKYILSKTFRCSFEEDIVPSPFSEPLGGFLRRTLLFLRSPARTFTSNNIYH